MSNMELQEALKILLVDESIDDFIYTIRDRAVECDPKFKGNSWEHPRVARYSQAVGVLRALYNKE